MDQQRGLADAGLAADDERAALAGEAVEHGVQHRGLGHAADELESGGRAAGHRHAPSLGAAGARAPVFREPGVAAPMKPLRVRVLLVLAVAAVLALPGAAHAATAMCNVPIRTGDGVVLRANIWLPSPTVGKVPTVLTVTGYNKDATNPTGQGCSGEGGIASADTSLADKGYAVMLVDDRGTGASQGKWDSWGERTQLDYQDILDWIQAQSWSNGSVATTGASYMGITSFLIAEADAARVRDGKPRAVKAIYADVPMSDAYRDVTFHGGAIDSGFIPLWLGLTTGLSYLPPSTWSSAPADAAAPSPRPHR